MSREALVAEVERCLVRRSLDDRPLEEIVPEVGEALRAAGVCVSRILLAWKVIHPLYRARDVVWVAGEPSAAASHWRLGERDRDAWERGPLRFFLASEDEAWHRDLSDPAVRGEFPMFEELFAAGHRSYHVYKVGFGGLRAGAIDDEALGVPGVVLSYCGDAPGGLTREELAILDRLKLMLALAARVRIVQAIAEAVATTYLGQSAGRRVLDGAIRRGDGTFLPAVIWYADMRGSTALAERLAAEDYIALLNRYFDATAGAALGAGGEVLDFIGDAVLAIFPADASGIAAAVRAARAAQARLEPLRGEGGLSEDGLLAGIAIARGPVMFGNVGIPERLTFSVVGPTVNAVARIEALTKALGEPVLVTAAIREAAPAFWTSRGFHPLPGMAEPVELFALAADLPDVAGRIDDAAAAAGGP